MAIFNGSRMVALFLFVLFALNASFAQDNWETIVVYMEDPIPVDEQLAPEAREYLDKLNDPFTWETEQDFQDARDAQIAQVAKDNETRKQAALDFLKEDMVQRGDGTSSWYPSWIPLLAATTAEDSLFKNALNVRGGNAYLTGPRAGIKQSVREFFEQEGSEPYEGSPDGFRTCDDTRRRCRKEFYARFRSLIETYDASLVAPAPTSPSLLFPALIWPSLPPSLPPSLLLPDASISPTAAARIISFTIAAQSTEVPGDPGEEIDDNEGFVRELNEEGRGISIPGEMVPVVLFDSTSVKLLQPAIIDPDTLSFHVRPAAKPASAAKASSWGRIKETFAD